MQRTLVASAVVALTLFFTGCLKDERTVSIKADGSGTIEIRTMMKSESIQQMIEMAKGMKEAMGGGEGDGEGEEEDGPENMFTEKTAKKKAAELGEGVEFVSMKPLKEEGWEGMVAVYSFKDITKVVIKPGSEDSPMGDDGPGGGGGGGDSSPKVIETIKFERKALDSGNTELTVITEGKEPEASTDEDPAMPEVPPEQQRAMMEQQLAMMKQMVGGLKMSVKITVEGSLVKSSSPHVDGNTVTIMSMDFDEMLEKPETFLDAAENEPKSLKEARELYAKMPGIVYHPEERTTIEFK